jgi:mRNA-degrading endonuclease RelE of RelBE toxin-antitoxin system
MSYALDVAPDAQSQWRELDVELQEVVLDELDLLANNPPADRTALVLDVVRDFQGARHYDFIQVLLNRRVRVISMIGASHHARPLS